MSHACPECGELHGALVVEDIAETAEPEAAVAIAEIEADRDVKLARIGADVAESDSQTRIAALEGEMHGMRDMLARLMPPEPDPVPEPVPVIVEPTPEPDPVGDPVVDAPPVIEPTPRGTKVRNPWW
jgi:hypothetical protein